MRRDAIRPSLLSFTALFFQTKRKVDRMKPQIGGFPDCLEVGCLQEV